MKLTKLELSGFKSFADTVTLTFDDGVTAIVGPNGCGKSNVSDAVRWVLGEQSARLLRGGKMEDVIFQGAANRRPVNVTEVSLYLDNSDGDLPIAYQEVVVTRRLSRSGQSDYLLNNAPVRLRDIQDLLRGTGLGSDAGVVIEAKMIDLLLSDRADERRSLFEEAAGIGLYRNRKHTTERRLEETSTDLQRLDDLIAEVQSQIRSLARQKGKAERHTRLMEEKFAVSVTLARLHLDDLEEQAAGLTARHRELKEELPATRQRLGEAVAEQERRSAARADAESRRTTLARELAAVQVALGKTEGDIGVARERQGNVATRRQRAGEERSQAEQRLQQAHVEREAAATERTDADGEHREVQSELQTRSAAEEGVRERLTSERNAVRTMEQELQTAAQTLHSLEGERSALEGELATLRERATQAQTHAATLADELRTAQTALEERQQLAAQRIEAARNAGDAAERARHLVAETREREARERAERRQAEESLAQLTARRQALEELERDRVGLAPAAAALLAARDRMGPPNTVLGPLSDFLTVESGEAELMERLLGDWMHAVLVQDEAAVDRIQRWHAEEQPGALVLLPVAPGPRATAAGSLDPRLRVAPEAGPWVRALVAGSEVLEASGRVFRRASGAVYLTGSSGPGGPLRRRAELLGLRDEVQRHERALGEILGRLADTCSELERVEQETAQAATNHEQARERERQAVAEREDRARIVANLTREASDADTQLGRIRERLARAESRLTEVDGELTAGELAQARLEEDLGAARGRLAALEAEQETARENRVHWQVREAHVGARLRATEERLTRAESIITEAAGATSTLGEELTRLDADGAALEAELGRLQEQRADQQATLTTLERDAAEAEEVLRAAAAALLEAEHGVADLRAGVELLSEEYHRLEVGLTEVAASRRSIAERIETEWKAPLATLEQSVQPLDLDRESLEGESERISTALEAIGPVNALAVEEHAEESKRLEFLTAQRDDLVAARQSLLQAIREIDGTARALFEETFAAVQANFATVFHTLFGGGECELRLADPEDPLESEIEIHAAPRGKRTQRIHLLSSGERTLVAVSLLFSIYLTKPSPFCLMDEVDAPLDDANVGRFTNLLDEFKRSTQFVVITHNPRTMHAADAVYGVTMQEPGVSTIVGVRLGEGAAVGEAGAPA